MYLYLTCALTVGKLMTDILREELETYQQNKKKLVDESNGKYVLIKGKSIIGVYESEKDALKEGITKFGNVPFLVKRIEEIEQVQHYTSNILR